MSRRPVLDDLCALVAARRGAAWLTLILLVGLISRIPGVFWGANFPLGWYGHHPDEYTHLVNAELLVDPSTPPRWDPNPYPKGAAGLVAAPVIIARLATGRLSEPPPSVRTLITAGRVVSVLLGTATVLVLMLLAQRLFKEPRTAFIVGGLTALGGLHVTQSHFFLADVPGLFWLMLGLYLLLVDLEQESGWAHQDWGAFAIGAAFGTKFIVAGLPTLGIVTLWRRPRLRRLAGVAVFAAAGFALVNLFSFGLGDIYDALGRGINDPYVYNRWFGALLYLIELPTVLSLPVVVLTIAGMFKLAARVPHTARPALMRIFVVLVLPFVATLYLILFKVDHFPRHLVQLFPWFFLSAGWALSAAAAGLLRRGVRPVVLIAPVFAYLGLFVLDAERQFLTDPRNQAAEWFLTHVPKGSEYWWNRHKFADYTHVRFPERGRPPVVVIEMLDANHYLSGMGWKDSYPADARHVFDAVSQERVEQMQALHRGTTEYREVARFETSCFMPEFVVIDRLIGDRSRSYVTDIVVFERGAPLPVRNQ